MKKLSLCFLLLFIGFSFSTNAQIDDVPLPKSLQRSDKQRDIDKKLRFTAGGGFGLQFGSSYAGVSLSPVVGVYPFDWLLIGVGANYSYTYSYGSSFHDFGVNVFVRGLIWQQRLIAHLGYEYLNLDYGRDGRFDAHALYLGPGYRQPLGDRVSLHALLLFNLANWNSSNLDTRSFFPFFYPTIGVTFDF